MSNLKKKILSLSCAGMFLMSGLSSAEEKSVFIDAWGSSGTVEESEVTDLPDWLKDSERLSEMLGGKVAGEVNNAKVISRLKSPIPGLDVVVVKANVQPPGKVEHEDIFTLFMDQTNRYMVAGMMIDTKDNRDIGTMIARYVKGKDADHPARALDVMSMSRLLAPDSFSLEDDSPMVLYVSDFYQASARDNLTAIHNLRAQLIAEGKKVKKFAVIPVSEGNDEMSAVASAMAFGYDAFNKGDGYNKMVQFSAEGGKPKWLNPAAIKADETLIRIVGYGIQAIDNNSSAALLAKVNSLPLVYISDGESAQWQVLPTAKHGWVDILVDAN